MQEGLIIYDNGMQDLILKVSPEISGDKTLNKFCWLITVPNEPEKYDVVDTDLFRQLYKMKTKFLDIPVKYDEESKSADKAKSAVSMAADVELGIRVKVGAYDIQPVRGVGPNAFNGLNNWLGDNGFPTEPESHMKYFIDNNFTFLCIKVNPQNQGEGIDKSPKLKPLHMTFKSDKIYYPMKYSSQQGDFKVNLYTLTSKPIDYQASQKTLSKIHNKQFRQYKNVNIIDRAFHKDVKKLVKNREMSHLYFNNFSARPNYNNGISNWKEDVFLNTTDNHSPDSRNMIYTKISWPKTIFLILGLISVVLVLFSTVKKAKAA